MLRSPFRRIGTLARKPWRWKPDPEGLAFWQERRLQVYLRDGGTCQDCGGKVSRSEAHIHHIRRLGMGGSRYNPKDKRNEVWNLTTLCKSCHKLYHA